MGQLIRAAVQLSVGQVLVIEGNRDSIRRALRLRRDQLVQA
jgi:hypothetical protein